MDIDTLKETLSDVYSIDDSVIEESVLDKIISKSLKKISRFYPKIEIGTLTSVSGTTRYTITEDNLIKLHKVYYNPSTLSCPKRIDPDIPDCGPTFSSSTVSNSRKFTHMMEGEMRKKLNRIEADIVDVNQFDLIPTPEEASTIYYEYERYRTISELSDLFEDVLLDLIFFYMEAEEYRNQQVLDGGNAFNFDRRGNVEDGDVTPAERRKERREKLKAIETDIQSLVATLG